jgi:hypothetical protein
MPTEEDALGKETSRAGSPLATRSGGRGYSLSRPDVTRLHYLCIAKMKRVKPSSSRARVPISPG